MITPEQTKAIKQQVEMLDRWERKAAREEAFQKHLESDEWWKPFHFNEGAVRR
jgi:hypothetical protein